MILWLEQLDFTSYRTKNLEKGQHVPTLKGCDQDLYLYLSSINTLLLPLIESLLILAAALIEVLDVSYEK